MNDASRVGASERVGNLVGVLCRDIRGQAALGNHAVKRLAGDVLHNHVVDVVLRTNVVNHADVRMLQARDRLRLLDKTGMRVGARRQVSRKNLDGDSGWSRASRAR